MKAPGSGDKDNWYQGEDKMWYLRNPSSTLRRRSGEGTKGRSRSTAFCYRSPSSGSSTPLSMQSPFPSPRLSGAGAGVGIELKPMTSPLRKLTVRRMSVPETFYESRSLGLNMKCLYQRLAEKQIKHFLFRALQKQRGSLLPDDLRFCLRDSRHIAGVKRHMGEAIENLSVYLPKDNFPSSSLYGFLNKQIKYCYRFVEILLSRKACFEPFMLLPCFKMMNEQMDMVRRYQSLFMGVLQVVRGLEGRNKKCEIFIQALNALKISVTKEISCYETKVNLLPETFRYSHLGARKSYQQEITIFHSIASLIGEIEKFIRWPSIKTDMKFDAFKPRLINMIFGVSEGVSLEAFEAFKRLFDCYQRNVDYLYELIGIKFHHAKHFFSKFLHKEVEYQIDHLLDLGGAISQRKYDEIKQEFRHSITAIYSKDPTSEEAFEISQLADILLLTYCDLDKKKQTEIPMEIFAQYTPALKSLILLRIDTDLSVKENHFIALREVELSPKLDLLRDSYFRVFDKLMALEKMVEIE